MGEKQRMLREALARQEDYHNALSHLNMSLEAAELRLKGVDQEDVDQGIAALEVTFLKVADGCVGQF